MCVWVQGEGSGVEREGRGVGEIGEEKRKERRWEGDREQKRERLTWSMLRQGTSSGNLVTDSCLSP